MPISQPGNGPLYIRILGRLFAITHVAQSAHEANEICFRDPTQSVIDTLGDYVLLARVDDKGLPAP
jgi:hypothetical protein